MVSKASGGHLAPGIGRLAAMTCTGLSLAYVAAQLLEWFGLLGSSGGPGSASTSLGLVVLLVPSLLLGPAYVTMIAALHGLTPPARKVCSLVALAFATAYATLTGLVYFVQLTFVAPQLAAGRGGEIALLLFVPYKSFLFAIDLYGYSLMCASALFAAFAFPRGRDARWVRLFLLLTGLLVPALAFQMLMPDLIWVGALWGVTFPAASWTLARYFARLSAQVGGGVAFDDEADRTSVC